MARASRRLRCGGGAALPVAKVSLDGAHFLADTVILGRQYVGDAFDQLDRESLLVTLARTSDRALYPGLRRLIFREVVLDDLAHTARRQTQPRIGIRGGDDLDIHEI